MLEISRRNDGTRCGSCQDHLSNAASGSIRHLQVTFRRDRQHHFVQRMCHCDAVARHKLCGDDSVPPAHEPSSPHSTVLSELSCSRLNDCLLLPIGRCPLDHRNTVTCKEAAEQLGEEAERVSWKASRHHLHDDLCIRYAVRYTRPFGSADASPLTNKSTAAASSPGS